MPNLTDIETLEKLRGVDWGAVQKAIEGWELPEHDAEKVLDLVLLAAKKWVPEDFAPGCEVGEVEELRVDGFFKGYADVTVVRSPEYMKVVDWKTTGSVDAAWKVEHERGWQALWYGRLWWKDAMAAKVPLFVEFRGIERGTGKTRLAVVEYDEEKDKDCDRLMAELVSWRQKILFKADGKACYSYGRPCEFLKDRCDKSVWYGMDEWDKFYEAPISPTSAKRIFECPRKNFLYQLDKIRGVGDNNGGKFIPNVNEKAAFGNAFHSGIAEVYRQLGAK